MSSALVLPLGEAALTIRLGETTSVDIAERAATLADALRRAGLDGVTEVVSAIASVTVFYDIDRVIARDRAQALREFVALNAGLAGGSGVVATHTISTRYDGPDLDEVAERVQLSQAEVVRRHVNAEYRVLALGFLPGWAYLGPLDGTLALPRRATPRTRVPAGSVGIMGTQTGIYPRVSPGGWHLIGSTDVALFAADRTPPALFAPGDRVQFSPVA